MPEGLRCIACGQENRAGRKFCGGCGARLAAPCPACGTPNEAGERFCGECGAPLGAPAGETPRAEPDRPASGPRSAVEPGVRKVVTVVFADLVGSTALHERIDAESARRLMERYYAALRAAVTAHGGTVVKLLGDGVMAAFGLKQVAEDDALRAVRAGAAMQDAFRALRAQGSALRDVGLRVAVNTGEVVVSGAQDDVIGDPVNVAARLQEQGRDGDVVVGESTRRLVSTRVTLAALGNVTLKGRAEAVGAYRLESLDPPATTAAVAFVGREDELDRLGTVYDGAATSPAARLAVLLGSPGLGKSRLIDEFVRRHAETSTVLAAHCDAAGGGTFAPLAKALRLFLSLDDGAPAEAARAAIAAALPSTTDEGERTRIAGGVGALIGGEPTSPEETFFVVRRFLAGLAAAHPVVLVIDDLHWAEPLLLDLIEHLIQWGGGVPLFVLAGARPELRDLRSSLVTPGGLVADVLTLGGLDAGAAMRLAANVIGAADLPAAVAVKVLATSEGNPLFVGELVRMLVQEGALTKVGDRWTAGAKLAAFEMPPTIHALLAARIERLRPEERTVLERASVVGRHFSRSAVAALLSRNGGELDARLEALRRTELIERDTGWFLGEPGLRFHHVLIRDAAYRRLLKETRAELHERLAGWIESKAGDAAEHDETIGWHLEQAHQHLRELGPIDDAGRVLGERAAARLSAAGRRALARDDVPLAASLLGRAIDRLDESHPTRADLALDWCEALLSAGDVGAAAAAIAELDRVAAGSDRLRAWHTCFTGQLTALTEPQKLQATSDAVAVAAEALAKLDDAAGEAKAHSVHAQALARLGRVGACEAALDRALAAARKAGDRRRANAVLAGAPLAARGGPSPVTRASGRCLDVVRVLRITQGAPAVEAVALSCQGVLEALRGRTDAARRMIGSSRKMVEELGIAHRLFEADVFAGRIDLLEGDAAAAEGKLGAAYRGLRDLGLGIDAARAGALLARARLAQGAIDDAEALSHESEALAGDDLQAAIAWRGVRAEALAQRGQHVAAVELAEAAVAIASGTDALLDHADARLALAAALRAGGRRADADAEKRRATELWEAKGATLLAGRAHGAGAHDEPPAPAERVAQATPVSRRIRENRAMETFGLLEAAIGARDLDAFMRGMADGLEVVHHPTAATLGTREFRATWRSIFRTGHLTYRQHALATLGDSLLLLRQSFELERFVEDHLKSVGAVETEEVLLVEVDADGRCRRFEIFAPDHLRDGAERLYERYGQLLPEGRERERALGAARSLERMGSGLVDRDRLVSPFSPAVEWVDRRIAGVGTLHGDAAVMAAVRGFLDLVRDARWRTDDVLACSADASVTRVTNIGFDRAGGGAFERSIQSLVVFDADGLVTRWETFEATDGAQALARFDALARAPAVAAASVRNRVRPNMVTRTNDAFEEAAAAVDATRLRALLADDAECIDHPTGSTYGVDDMAGGVLRLMRSPNASFRQTPIATLGTSLCLARRRMSASGSGSARFDVGAYEIEDVAVFEADERGRIRCTELFSTDHLGDALVRLYERHAELLPDGAERTRAAAIARSVAVWNGPIVLDRVAIALGTVSQFVDHRVFGTWGARSTDEILQHWRLQLDLAPNFAGRYDDVLALDAHAVVARMTFFGTGLESGGAFENRICVLFSFDADGRMSACDVFEPEREAEALARFDALTAGSEVPLPGRRRPSPNDASTTAARFEAAFAARDTATLETLFADALEVVDHQNGATYGRAGQLASLAKLAAMRDASLAVEPLATLGSSHLLWRRRIHATGTAGGRYDVGEYEREEIVIFEVDRDRHVRRVEIFAAQRLHTAIIRLYERYADSLPEGSERTRGRAIAGSLTAFDGSLDADRIATGIAPSFVCIDHRSLGPWSGRGPAEWLEHWRLQADLAAGFAMREEDVLALDPTAMLTRQLYLGTDRTTGGSFENVILALNVFDDDGLIAHTELFEPDQQAEALARFDALAVRTKPAPARRRPRRNAAVETCVVLEAAFARRDLDAIGAVLADSMRTIEHPTGTTYGRAGQIETCRRMLQLPDLAFRAEPLATLGDSLCLGRRVVTASGTAGGRFDVGEYEIESIFLNEVDGSGRLASSEVFASNHLCDAIARLYARYAELLPEGPERTRAAEIARSQSVWDAPLDPDRIAGVYAPSFVCLDHRTLGTWSVQGQDEWRQHLRGQTDLAAGLSRRDDDVLALAPAACVTRSTFFGTNRATGGSFENLIISLNVFDDDGRVARSEVFEPDREAEALARFDELIERRGGAPGSSVSGSGGDYFANAAVRLNERFLRAWAARDWDGIASILSAKFDLDDRRPLMQVEGTAETNLAGLRFLFDVPRSSWTITPIATRGERLVITRTTYTGDAEEGGGPLVIDYYNLNEVDGAGRCRRVVLFALDDLDAAYAELERSWEAGEVSTLGAKMRRLVNRLFTPFTRHVTNRDWEALVAACAPDMVEHDHRPVVGLGTTHGAEVWAKKNVGTYADLVPDTSIRLQHLRAVSDGILWQVAWEGAGGGIRYEIPMIGVSVPDEHGRLARIDIYDPEQQWNAALARFAELQTSAPADPFANTATRTLARATAALCARDWEGFVALFANDFRVVDRTSMAQLESDGAEYLAAYRDMMEMTREARVDRVLATRGDRLALAHAVWRGAGGDVGPSEVEWLQLVEVDERGDHRLMISFDPHDVDAAYEELDRRYESGEGAALGSINSRYVRAMTTRRWDAMAALCAPAFVQHDHRSVAVLGTVRGAAALVEVVRALVELAPDTGLHIDHIRHGRRGFLWQATQHGSRDGGRFELRYVGVTELDDEGLLARLDFYDPEDLERARRRFDEVEQGSSPAPSAARFANAVTRFLEHYLHAWARHDWSALADTVAPSCQFDDRRPLLRMELPREGFLEQHRTLFDVPNGRWTITRMATRGERLMIARFLFEGEVVGGGGALEIDHLIVFEADGDDRAVAIVLFEPDDLDAAYAELDARWAAREAAEHPRASKWLADYLRAFAARDWTAMTALLAPDLVGENHRLVGWGTRHGPAGVVSTLRAQIELAPDTRERVDHVRTCDDAVLIEYAWIGTREGGAFENVWVVLVELAPDGRARRADVWEPEQLEQARARFAEIAARTRSVSSPARFANAASRNLGEQRACFRARDWRRLHDLLQATFRCSDRRRMAQLELDRERYVDFVRHVGDMAAVHPEGEVVATRGDRLALARIRFEGADGDVGPSVVEDLNLIEVDATGACVARVRFDLADLDAAYAELDRRHGAGEGAAHLHCWKSAEGFVSAVRSRDFDAIVALCAESLVEYDHRALAVLGTTHGGRAWMENFRTLAGLSPDTVYRVDHFRAAARGYYSHGGWHGSREGGAYEIPVNAVIELDDDGLIVRADIYDDDGIDAALERFEALVGSSRVDLQACKLEYSIVSPK